MKLGVAPVRLCRRAGRLDRARQAFLVGAEREHDAIGVSRCQVDHALAAARAAVRGGLSVYDDFVDRFGIVGPVERAVPRFERLAALGLDFCRVVPGSRDAPREVLTASMMNLATAVRPAVA